MDTAADFLGASFLSDVQVKTCVFCEHNAMVSCVPAPIVHTLPCDKLRVVNVSQTESLDDLLQFTFIVKMPSLLQRQLQTDVKMNICERCSSYLVAFDLPRECVIEWRAAAASTRLVMIGANSNASPLLQLSFNTDALHMREYRDIVMYVHQRIDSSRRIE